MGIFNWLLSMLFGSGGMQGKVLDLIKGQLLGQGNSGLGSLVEGLTKGGLSKQVESWVSTGKNEKVSGDQIGSALGQNKLEELSKQSGLSPDILKDQLAKLLPGIIDKLTPGGKLPG
ncbi:MAG: YidB family protein [Fimbriiglobus sp.]